MRITIQSIVFTALLLLSLSASPALSDEPITYRGILMPVEGFPHIPHCGTTLHITVQSDADGKLSGRLRAMGVDAQLAHVERINGTLNLRGYHRRNDGHSYAKDRRIQLAWYIECDGVCVSRRALAQGVDSTAAQAHRANHEGGLAGGPRISGPCPSC